jgi:hypothetical protein
MRTTIRVDDGLLAAAKERAARTGRTLTALFEDALRAFLARDPRPRERGAVRLPTFDGGGPQPGVDLDNTADLLDLMEGRDATR